MSELLLELFSEEIPAMMQKKAAAAYKEIFAKYLLDRAIGFDQINVYSGVRRLTIHVTNVSRIIASVVNEIKGPKITAPQKAIDGFCYSNNITRDDLSRTIIKNIAFYMFKQTIDQQLTKDVLLASLHIPISEYSWSKSMYWGDCKIKWVRPLRNILCVFDQKIIPFKYGHLVANNQCFGHRFMSPKSNIIHDFIEYNQALEDNFVLLDFDQRKQYIQQELSKKALELNLVINNDESLLEEVSNLVEYPQILVGKINKDFLSLPSEILVVAMKTHQKYFSLFDKDDNFAPYFLFVSNIRSTDSQAVISGNEKVLSARLSDALYFYNQDIKTSLAEKSQLLEKVIFHAKLGNLKEKTLRIEQIVKFVDSSNKVAMKSALLCKSDIISEIVNEFPTLQGIMGYYYAKHESLDNEVALTIRDHYKPQGLNDQCSKNNSAILALADKIDNLCGLILAGEKPSGSKDPYALRRQALGIIRIIIENRLDINLKNLITFTIDQYSNIITAQDGTDNKIILFFAERLKYFFKNHYNFEIISAVLDLDTASNIAAIHDRLAIIKEFLSDPKSSDVLASYKRTHNIISTSNIQGKIDQSLLKSEYEKKLFDCICTYEKKITKELSEKNYLQSLHYLTIIAKPISDFFDNVMVNDKNESIANNRILLLKKVKEVFDKVAKFDQL